ncbi:hypothetical protein [Microbacterium sp. cf332]|uniref:hypothetical protein n=1 Tax=Microbacterium sp. cf332 TaxID=1761804 RepID=UPI000886B983|nr:hypothetical protein [Microbacterium sp. cf332]SDQ31364.1 hypothetical protein SAMN04487847_1368 [Microbacterium sp. cf332]
MSTTWGRGNTDRRRIGAWEFDLRGDEFADIRLAGRWVLRSIRAVVRDRDWNTVDLVVDRVTAAGSSVTLHVRAADERMPFHGVVRAEVRGESLRVLCDLEAAIPVETNRAGLVALIPPAAAGAGLSVTHSTGAVSETALPLAVSPHQPVFDIAGLHWYDDGLAIGLAFDGDVFEMEDQRNWTDASFKVYSRPLALPFPYPLDAGERVRQVVTITAHADAPATSATGDAAGGDAAGGEAAIELAARGVFPAIGLAASSAPDPAPVVRGTAGTSAAASSVGAASTLVELDLAWPGWRAALERAAAEGPPLDVRLVLPAEAGVSTTVDAAVSRALSDAVSALAGLTVARITAFQPAGPARHVSDAASVARLRSALRDAGLDVPVVGGARTHFTELNREHHRLPGELAGIVFSVTPLFHSRDTEQLVESLAMQRLVAVQAVEIGHGLPVHVGPITLRPHVNAVATTAPPRPVASDLSGGYGSHLIDADDPRQRAPELAAWTIASTAALAVPGIASLTFFESWGPRGIVGSDGTALPLAEAVAALAALAGGELLSGRSPDGLVWAVGAQRGGQATVLAANLDTRERVLTTTTPTGACTISLAPGAWSRV